VEEALFSPSLLRLNSVNAPFASGARPLPPFHLQPLPSLSPRLFAKVKKMPALPVLSVSPHDCESAEVVRIKK
jgi:hypothetical protein